MQKPFVKLYAAKFKQNSLKLGRMISKEDHNGTQNTVQP